MPRPKLYDRDTVLANALGIFWDKGFEATSLSDLMAATGLNKKSLYNEFGSKDALFYCALESYIQQVSRELKMIFNREPLGIDNIISALGYLRSVNCERGCPIALAINEYQLLNDAARSLVKTSRQGLQRGFAFNLSAAGCSEAQVMRLSEYCVAFTYGYGTLYRLQEGKANKSPNPISTQTAFAEDFDMLRTMLMAVVLKANTVC